MSKTMDNLKAAFAGESQANRKYTAYAAKADADGYPQIAKLFRAAAAGETVHAISEFKAMGAVKSTAENLQDAIKGENYEVVTMYPDFIKDSEAEGENRRADVAFKNALAVEKIHEALYREALAMVEAGKKEETLYDYYVCPVCGFVEKISAPERCPVCGTPGTRFELIA
ncbi:rubrerythrin family protein [bacterium]|nr:MAG: rubrerythrin family protein [bacterium]